MRLLERFHTALQSLSKAERHRRKAERDRLAPLPPLTPAEQVEYSEIVKAWKTGEFPLVQDHDEPIGPRAPLPAFYAGLLAESSTRMSPHTVAKLEGPTGCWRVGEFAPFEQFEVSR